MLSRTNYSARSSLGGASSTNRSVLDEGQSAQLEQAPMRTIGWCRAHTPRGSGEDQHRSQTTIAIAIAIALASACGRTSATPIGSRRYEALPPGETVLIFTSEKEVEQPFQVVALVTYNNPGKYQILSIEDAIPALKDKARAAGANGIIIDQSFPVKSGFISTGIHVSGRAIRFTH